MVKDILYRTFILDLKLNKESKKYKKRKYN